MMSRCATAPTMPHINVIPVDLIQEMGHCAHSWKKLIVFILIFMYLYFFIGIIRNIISIILFNFIKNSYCAALAAFPRQFFNDFVFGDYGTHEGCRYMIHGYVFVAAALVAAKSPSFSISHQRTSLFPVNTFSISRHFFSISRHL